MLTLQITHITIYFDDKLWRCVPLRFSCHAVQTQSHLNILSLKKVVYKQYCIQYTPKVIDLILMHIFHEQKLISKVILKFK